MVAITVAALVCCVPFFIFRNKNDIMSSVFVCCLSVVIASSVFITKTVTDYMPAIKMVSEEKRVISGTLCEYEESYGKHYYTLRDVSVNSVEIDDKIRVSSDFYKNADIDDIFTFTDGVIYELGASSGNTDSYKANNIYLGAYTQENFQITKAEKHSAGYYLNEMRQYISESLNRNIKPEYASIANAMLTGDISGIDESTLTSFRFSGIAHLFAVSGFHLSLWSGAFSFFLSRIFKNKYILNNCLCIVFVICFMALTGFSKSVLRAGFMLILVMLARITKYKSDPVNSLFISVSVILLLNPYAVMSISLQMSFLATLGILIYSKPLLTPVKALKKKISIKPLYRFIFASYSTVMISITASLFTLPVSALSFGYISVIAPVTNLLCAFPSQALILISGIYTAVSEISFLAKPMAVICTYIARFLTDMTSALASADHAVMDTTSPILQTILICALIVMVFFTIIFRESNKKLMITLLSSAAAVAIISASAMAIQSDAVKISVADTGNGTAVVYHSGETDIIIGSGGSTYRSYKLTNITDRISDGEYDLLIIPRKTKYESEYVYKLLNRYSFESCVFSDENYPAYITDLIPENSVFTDNCNIQIDTDTTLLYNNSKEFSGVRIVSGDFTCTVLFRALSDFSVVPEDWKSGSLLITRQSLPDIDLSGFENIIVSSSKEVIYTNRNIYTTRFSGKIDYRMYHSGAALITEERHDYKR